MIEKTSKLKGKAVKEVLKGILSSNAFPFLTAAVLLFCYYLGLDIVAIYYLVIVGSAMVLLLDDLTALVPQLVFLGVIVSLEHSPTTLLGDAYSDYYLQPAVLTMIAIAVALYLSVIVVRLAKMLKEGRFKPDRIFVGLCIFALALVLNGFFTLQYTILNFVYGALLGGIFVGAYVLISGNITLSESNYIKLGWGFFAFSLLLAIELIFKYIGIGATMLDGEGSIIKEMFVFGWGVWNTIGMYLVLCIPAVMFLSTKYRHGWLFMLYGTVLTLFTFLTLSRQAMLIGTLAYIVSVIFALIKSRNKAISIPVFALMVCAGVVVILIKWDTVARLLGNIMDKLFSEEGEFTGNGRMSLIYDALNYFATAPVFGRGFHINFSEDAGFIGLNGFVPLMAHNTFAELLATCGLMGFVAYLLHRIQTFVEFVGKITINKIFFAIMVSALLLLSMLDNHIFYVFPTIVYAAVLPFALGKGNGGKAVISPKTEKPIGAESTICRY